MNTNRGFASLIVILLVVALGLGGYYAVTQTKSDQSTTEEESAEESSQTAPAQSTAGEKTYSSHSVIKAYLQGPSEVSLNTAWRGSIVVPVNVLGVAGAPDVEWGDGTSDTEISGTLWKYDNAGNAMVSHTYKKAGTYTITVNINGGAGVGFEKGTVVIKKTITVTSTSSVAPTIKASITAVKVSEDRREITVSYQNMPKEAASLFLCIPAGQCTEWGVSFAPTQSNGTFVMVPIRSSSKSISDGIYTIQAVDAAIPKVFATSEPFKIDSANTIATPNYGSAPLTVTFGIPQSAGGQYINFGDGTNGSSVPGSTSEGMVPALPQTFTHTYTKAGIYTVVVSRLMPSGTTAKFDIIVK
jgi:PKD repeat protein